MVSTKMDKTVVVAVRWQQRVPIYKKSLRRVTKFYAHDKDNTCRLGDLVRIQETRTISRNKHWRVLETLERKDVVEVRPIELDEGVLSTQSAEEDQGDET